MSNATPFAIGLGGGLALWQLARSRFSTKPPTSGSSSAPHNGERTCHVRLDGAGLTADGARGDVADAVRRCQAIGRAVVTVEANAPAATYAELMTALRAADVPTYPSALGSARNAPPQTKDFFTLITYPRGNKDKPTHRYFRAEKPITWAEARDRLAQAGLLDLDLAGRTYAPGGWMLSIASRDFRAHRAEPLPAPRNGEMSSTFTLVEFPDGIWGKRRERWFRAEPATTWDDARDRLVAARLLDPSTTKTWKLITDPARYRTDRAEPLPGRRNGETASTFTLAVYPEGTWGPTKRVRWFLADPPTTWEDARDRLAAAGLLDARVIGPNEPGHWILTTEPRLFDAERATSLPDAPRRTRDASPRGRYALDGRTILRDGEAILRLERVDLGDARFAISPHHADVLAHRIVRLLNRQGAR